MKVAYRALDERGLMTADVVEAASVAEAVETLRRGGLFVTEVHEANPRARAVAAGPRREHAEAGRLRLAELLFFTRQMSMLLHSGSPVVPALTAIGKQLRGPAAGVIGRLRQGMESGRGLADSMRQCPGVFSDVYSAVVAAGEATANLPEMFTRLGAWVQYRVQIRNRVLSAAAYPAVLLVLSLIIVLSMVTLVVPRFEELFLSLGAPLPWSTRTMFDVASFLRASWGWMAAAAAGAVLGAAVIAGTATGRQWISNAQTRIPLAGRLFKRLIQAQIFRVLGLLLSSRVGLLDAVRLCQKVSPNRDFRRLCETMHQDLHRGGRFSDSLAQSPLISAPIAQAVATGEESGRLDQAMLFVADVLDDENAQIINTLTKLLEPAILILMGGIVGAIALSLFVPLFDLAASAR